MKKLLILSDCKSKNDTPEPMHYLKVFTGKMFQTFRLSLRQCEQDPADYHVVVLSAKYGLLWDDDHKIENYMTRISVTLASEMKQVIAQDFVDMWDKIGDGVDQVFVSLSQQHLMALPLRWVAGVVGDSAEVVVAHGGLGARQGQLKVFLCGEQAVIRISDRHYVEGGGKTFTFQNVMFEFSMEDALAKISKELKDDPFGAQPTTWYCEIDGRRVSVKYAMRCLVGRDIAMDSFTTQRAVQILGFCGIPCNRLDL